MGGFFAGKGMTRGVFDRYNRNVERNQTGEGLESAGFRDVYIPYEMYNRRTKLRFNLLRYLRRSIIQLGSARRIRRLHYVGITNFHTSVVKGLEMGRRWRRIYLSP
jgi:hypothetical protein